MKAIRQRRVLKLVCGIAMLSSAVGTFGQQSAPPKHLFFHISLPTTFTQPVSGRLLVFVAQTGAGQAGGAPWMAAAGAPGQSVDVNPMAPTSVYVAAKEVYSWVPGTTTDVDADDIVYPGKLSDAKAGDYQIQAVLDVAHNYNYSGRGPGDLISDVISLKGWDPGKDDTPAIALSGTVPESAAPPSNPTDADNSVAVKAALKPIDVVSPSLTKFSGRDTAMRGWVLLPPGYSSLPKKRYPTVYFTHGFGGNLEILRARFAPMLYGRMQSKKMPEMIWVLLDESGPTGTHEFADGVNNGPWGHALTTELLPYLESHYRMDAKVSGRFLQGHSSGGWATLWLQTTYPKIFGGAWSTSPDPSDFHSFSSVDLYAPHANFYRQADGTAVPIIRADGQVVSTMEQLAKMEAVLGDYGGQIASFEWVFSPRGPDGRPMPMFNRQTGDVDPFVIGYWRDHYDIAHRVAANWPALAPDLRGKVHLFVGTADTFYLDGAAHRLQTVLDGLHADGHFTFLPGRSHFDLYKVGDDRYGLYDQIAKEMYTVARGPSARR